MSNLVAPDKRAGDGVQRGTQPIHGYARRGGRRPTGVPNAADVLAAIAPGRDVRVRLSPEQAAALRDREGQLALRLVRAVVAVRTASVAPLTAPDEFPIVEHFVQAAAAALGVQIGQKRARRLAARLVQARVLSVSPSSLPLASASRRDR